MDSTQEIFDALRTRYGTSAQQAQECLFGLKTDSQGSVYDLAAKIGHLVGLAHPYLLTGEKD